MPIYIQHLITIFGISCILGGAIYQGLSARKSSAADSPWWLIAGLLLIVLEEPLIIFTDYSQRELSAIHHIEGIILGFFAIAMFRISGLHAKIDKLEAQLREREEQNSGHTHIPTGDKPPAPQ
jgi:dipeptide/tripeptide permease